MKKTFFFSGLLIIVIGLALFGYDYFVLKNKKGALQITSSPQSKVYLNNEYIGNTPLCRCGEEGDSENIGELLPVGEYQLRLEPVGKELQSFTETINIEPSVLTVVDRKFDKSTASESFVITLNKLGDKNKNMLTVVSNPVGASVFLDGNEIGKTPIQKNDIIESDHNLVLSKKGYKTKSVKIKITNGYKLTAVVGLGVDVEILNPQKKSSESAQVSPTPEIKKSKVKILETGTGFLRVREENSLISKEVTRVNPGQEFELIERNDEWTKIKLQDGKSGWVSSQYVEEISNLSPENIDNDNN